MERTGRKVWVDYAKAIGIYLVLLGHFTIPPGVRGRIYAFHMPLFFFLSGYLFSSGKFASYRSFLIKRGKQILIPYFFYAIVSYVFWLVIGRHFGDDANRHIPLYIPLVGTLYSAQVNDFLIHNVPLWFLTCLFVVEALYYLLKKVSLRYLMIILLLCSIIGYFDSTYASVRLPWNIDVALTAIIFYASGNLVKEFFSKELFQNMYTNIVLCITIFPVFYFTAQKNLSVDFASNNYGNYLYMYLNAFLGITFFIAFCKVLAAIFNTNAFIEFVAQNTLSIMAINLLAMSFLKGFCYFILHYPVNAFDFNTEYAILLSAIILISILPVIYVINKYLPFFLGKSPASTKKSVYIKAPVAN